MPKQVYYYYYYLIPELWCGGIFRIFRRIKKHYFAMAKTEPVLRKSLFIGVPPFINFVPGGGFPGEVIRGPQYWDHDNWDQDQLWRVALAMARWIEVIMI